MTGFIKHPDRSGEVGADSATGGAQAAFGRGGQRLFPQWTTPQLRFVADGLWYGLLALLLAAVLAWVDWDVSWAGRDLSRYLAGAEGLLSGLDPYTGTQYVYSPAWALLVSPLNIVPFPLALALWRIAELAALVVVLRGSGPLGWALLAAPWLWNSELVSANMMGFATAAMIAVIRWPSVSTVIVYAALVALVPKPALLPVMAYGFIVVPAARRWVAVIGLAGLAMFAWPGYLSAVLHNNEGYLAPWHWAQPWAIITAAILTLCGLKFPRLLGPAGVLAAPYAFPYALTPLGTLVVKPGKPARPSPTPGSLSRAPGADAPR